MRAAASFMKILKLAPGLVLAIWLLGNAHSASAQSIDDPAVIDGAMKATKALNANILLFTYLPRSAAQIPPQGAVQMGDTRFNDTAYNYFKGATVSGGDLSLPIIARSLDGRVAMGPNGYFAATDPAISRAYGGPDWAMIELTLPAGTRYLDTRVKRPLDPAFRAYLNSVGCRANSASALSTSDDIECRKALKDIMAKTGTSVISYYFKKNIQSLCRRSQGDTATAFIFLGTEPVARQSLHLFTAEFLYPNTTAVQQEARYITDFFRTAGMAGPYDHIFPNADRDAVSAWAHDNLYRCGSGSGD